MTRPITRRIAGATAALGTAMIVMTGVPAAVAGTSSTGNVPFSDPSAHGSLTLCNRAGQPMTSGSIYTRPFAWKVVSSAPAPSGYRVTYSSRDELYAFQPIQYVDPSEWTGALIIGASSFNQVTHPVDQANDYDNALSGFVNSYPPHWQGLIQLRLFFSGLEQATYTTTYPTAVIRINGTTWTLVRGGGGSCTTGHGVSNYVRVNGKKVNSKPLNAVPIGAVTPAAAIVSPGQPGSGKKGSAGPGSTTAPGPTTTNLAESSGSSSRGLGSGAKAGIALAVLAVLGLGGTAFALRRRGSS